MEIREPKDRVVVRGGDGKDDPLELVVDGARVRHGRFPDGTYFLYENAYVWSKDLRQLGRQLVTDRAQHRVPSPAAPPEGE